MLRTAAILMCGRPVSLQVVPPVLRVQCLVGQLRSWFGRCHLGLRRWHLTPALQLPNVSLPVRRPRWVHGKADWEGSRPHRRPAEQARSQAPPGPAQAQSPPQQLPRRRAGS